MKKPTLEEAKETFDKAMSEVVKSVKEAKEILKELSRPLDQDEIRERDHEGF